MYGVTKLGSNCYVLLELNNIVILKLKNGERKLLKLLENLLEIYKFYK